MLELLLFIIIIKLFSMSAELNEIKEKLIAADAKVTKVAADVQRLHDLIAAAGEVPTAAEWAEVKALADGLNASLQAVDDATSE